MACTAHEFVRNQLGAYVSTACVYAGKFENMWCNCGWYTIGQVVKPFFRREKRYRVHDVMSDSDRVSIIAEDSPFPSEEPPTYKRVVLDGKVVVNYMKTTRMAPYR